MRSKQIFLGILLSILTFGSLLNGCSFYKKNHPLAPDFASPTITLTPTFTHTGTLPPTSTPTITRTFTISFTPTITNTHVNATDTPTLSPTVTFTLTPTATLCTGAYYDTDYTFDHDVMCWKYENDPNSLNPSAAWDPTVGYSSAGSVSLYVPFTAANQQVLYAGSFGATPMDLTGKRITVHLRVDSWANNNLGTTPGGVMVVVKSTPNGTPSWIYASSAWQNISSTGPTWLTLTLDPASPSQSNSGYDPTQICQIGVQLNTNSAGTSGAAVFHLDDVTVTSIQPPTSTPTPGGPQGWTFDTTIAPWAVDPGNAAPLNTTSVAAWDGTVDGNNRSSSGSVSLYVPFSGNGQDLLFSNSFQSTPIDLSGKKMTCQIRVDSWAGANLATSPGLAQIVLKTGSGWVYGAGAWVNLTATGTWYTLTLPNASSPAMSNTGYDPTQVIQAAVDIQSGGAPGTFGAAVFHIDNWLYQ